MLTIEPTIEDVVDLLSNRNAYPDRPSSVQQIETHISRVFLTDRYVYKLKKPVKFDFLDFSTPDLRRIACNEELRLNRRLATNIYLDVLPIVIESNGRLKLNGIGVPIDWVVKMRRLPSEKSLDQRIRTKCVNEDDVSRVASKLTDFYQQLPPLTIKVDDYRRQIESHVEDNFRELSENKHHFAATLLKRLHHAQLRLLRLAPDLLDNRVRDGRIVDGHGDLRPEHIYVNGQPTIIDCLEFSAELRSLDVLDELAFLAMECDILGAEWIGREILRHYQKTSGDHPPTVLLAFYKMYRACVRAKVHSLRALQLDAAESKRSLGIAKNYLQCCEQYCHELGPPLLLVVRGLPGTGKSTLATMIAESLDMDLLQTDAARREMFGELPPVGFDEQQYHIDSRNRVYEKMFAKAKHLLQQGQSVVLDGTFLSAKLREQAIDIGQRYKAESLMICCECPKNVAIERIESRLAVGNSLSDARPEIYAQLKQLDVRDPPRLPAVHLDTTLSPPELQQSAFAYLRDHLFPDSFQI